MANTSKEMLKAIIACEKGGPTDCPTDCPFYKMDKCQYYYGESPTLADLARELLNMGDALKEIAGIPNELGAEGKHRFVALNARGK